MRKKIEQIEIKLSSVYKSNEETSFIVFNDDPSLRIWNIGIYACLSEGPRICKAHVAIHTNHPNLQKYVSKNFFCLFSVLIVSIICHELIAQAKHPLLLHKSLKDTNIKFHLLQGKRCTYRIIRCDTIDP